MKRVWLMVATIAALTAACLATSPALAKGPQTGSARHVTLILAPYLTWDDVSQTSMPSLWRLAENGALASVNARSRVRLPGQGATPLEGALAVSSGAWAFPEWKAPPALNATETYSPGSAAAGYERIFGSGMGSARIAYLGLPMTERANKANSAQIVLGTLGEAVSNAGGLTAAVGNSDLGYSERDAVLQRPAAIAAMDASGVVAYGDVSADLLVASANAPYGKTTDLDGFETAYDRVRLLTDAHAGPSFVVLDAGDLSRAREFSWQVTDSVALRHRNDALAKLDAVIALADARRGPDEVVIVASQALFSDRDGAPQGAGPLIVTGPGFSGYATSSSTHRAGLVTNLDITACVLDVLGIPRPVQVLGNPMSSRPGPADVAVRAEALSRANDAYVAVDGLRASVSGVLVGLAVVAFALAALLAARAPNLSDRAVRWWSTALRSGLLLLLAIPAASWIAFVLYPRPGSVAAASAALAATAVALATITHLAARRLPTRVPVAGLSLLTAIVLLAEQFVGAPVSIVSPMGYSAVLGARYYGMGNDAAAIVFGSTLVGVALLLDAWPDAPVSGWMRRWGIGVLGVVVVGIAAAPFLGANVGVAVWGIVGFGLAWLLMSGRRVTGGRLLAIALAVAIVIGAFAAIDLVAGGAQTHLGRAISGAREGGLGTLWTILTRKAAGNARVLSKTALTWILVAVSGLVAFARWRPSDVGRDLFAENPHLAKALVAAAAGGVVAFFSEDSGIAIPSLVAVYAGAALAWLMTERRGRGRDGGEPA